MYIGLGVYRMSEKPTGLWKTPAELLWQIRDIRQQSPAPGMSFYSTSCFAKAGKAVRDSLSDVYNKYPAFPPTMRWIDSIAPASPSVKGAASATGNVLDWQVANPAERTVEVCSLPFHQWREG